MNPSPPPSPKAQPSIVQSLWRAVPYVLVAIALYFFFAPRASGPQIGEPASSFDLPLLVGEGDRIRLEDWRGEPVLIEVYASWCPSCRTSSGTFNDVARARREGPVHFLAVSLDDEPEAGRQAALDWGFVSPVAHGDGSFARDYKISVLPTVILVDAEGKVRHAANGSVSKNKLEKWLSEVGASRL